MLGLYERCSERRSSGFASHNPRITDPVKGNCFPYAHTIAGMSRWVNPTVYTNASTKPIIHFFELSSHRSAQILQIVYTGHNMLLQLSKNSFFMLPPHLIPQRKHLHAPGSGISCGCSVKERQDQQKPY